MLLYTILLSLGIILVCAQDEPVTPLYDPKDCVVDVGFSLDGSGSLGLANWMLTLRFVSEFASNVKFGQDGTRIGVVSFGNAATLDVALDAYNDVLAFGNTVQQIWYKDENTNTASGIRLMTEQLFNVTKGDRLSVPNVGIVVTDGASTWEKNLTVLEANKSRDNDIIMFAIGIGQEVNFVELRAIANKPSDTYLLYVDEFTDLKNITDRIVNLACGHQIPVATPGIDDENIPTTVERSKITTTEANIIETSAQIITTVSTAGTTATEQKQSTLSSTTINTTSININTTPTTKTETSPTQSSSPPTTQPSTVQPDLSTGLHKIDIALLLDSSGSIGWNSWQQAKGFVKNFIKLLHLETNIVRFALIEYSTQAYLKIPLGNYSSSSEVEEMVENLDWLNQRTNTSGAIRMAYEEVFSLDHSNRPDATDVILVVTDGDSNTDNHYLKREGDMARSRGINMFTVGIGNKTSMEELHKITSKPYYFFMHLLKDFESLPGVIDLLQQEVVRESYPITSLPVSFDDCPTDLAIVVDVPQVMADQAVGIANSLTNEASPSDKQHMLVIMTAQTGYEESVGENLADAIRYIRESIFSTENNEDNRQDVQNVVVVITTTMHGYPDALRYQMDNLKIQNIKVYTITIGAYSSEDILRDLTSDPKENTYNNLENIDLLEGDLNLLSHHTNQICALASRILWSCGFELSEPPLCNMRSDPDADFQWTVSNVHTPSHHTGPDRAYDGDFFAFIEASSPRRNGDKAIFYLPFTADGVFCLTFRYHMKGYHIGVLDIFVLRKGSEKLMWRMSGQQGEDWLYAQQLLILSEGDEVGIRGIRAKEFSGDIGIDTFAISRGPCPGDM